MELISILVSTVTALVGLLIGIVSSAGRLNKMNELLIKLDVKSNRVEEHETKIDELFTRMRKVENRVEWHDRKS
jgi:hypothetical protein